MVNRLLWWLQGNSFESQVHFVRLNFELRTKLAGDPVVQAWVFTFTHLHVTGTDPIHCGEWDVSA